MTIRFLKAWNGYSPDAVATLSAGLETTLKAAGIARDSSVRDGPDFGGGALAEYSLDPTTGAVVGLVGPDGVTVPLNGVPFDTVSISSTTAAIRSAPCQVAGLSCSASSSLNARVYANSANSGTVIWEGALTLGQIVTLPEPYSSFLGVSVQFVSGTGTIALYVR